MDSTPEHLSDEAVVLMTLEERAHFGLIVDRYQDKLSRYVMRLGVRNAEDRDDVLQEIFIKVFKNLNGFNVSLSFSSWIYRIAHNEAISWYRKQNVRPEGHLVDDGETVMSFIAGAGESAEVEFDKGVNETVITKAIADLDEKYRTVLILRFFEHKEYEEISDILKIPVGSVGTLVHRGKKQLRKLVDEEKVRI